ncbi:MAG: ABC transporter substrate-binding protein [Pseudolabrys sp.]|nr:ABC transporter substrate-binding protein [Pseudolabrys sp.]MDP2294185.1 ABC transporter substrate-binding protein [Pseudolabrys sp.]
MIRRSLAAFFLILVISSASAQERVSVGTTRAIANAVLFLGVEQGHFKAEGLDVEMTAYASDQDVVEALAAGATDMGLAGFTAQAFNLAGSGAIKAVAAQVREKADYEGNDIIVSTAAYDRGVRKAENLAGVSFASYRLGTALHYQFGQVARLKKFDIAGVTLKPQGSLADIARVIAAGSADAAILPGTEARALLTAGQAKLIAWYSELDETQLGALFASSKAVAARRATVEKFVRAYRRAATEYAAAFLRNDRYGKRVTNARTKELSGKIARYVFPGRPADTGTALVEAGIYNMDREARLDAADTARQVGWYQAQNLVDKSVDARAIVDSSFK